MPIPRIKAAAIRHIHCLALGKRHAQPGVIGLSLETGVALHLKLEQRSVAKQTVHFAYVILDDLTARNMLKYDRRKCKIEFTCRNYGEIFAIVLIYESL